MKVVIIGASGRVGRRLIALTSSDSSLRLAGAVVSPQSQFLGQDSGSVAGVQPNGIAMTSTLPDQFDAVIDFSSPDACLKALNEAVSRKAAVVLATTGLSTEQMQEIQTAAKSIPICFSPNTSLAVNLTMKLAEQVAQTLKRVNADVDVEIIERHHRFKEDSPSGTAIQFGKIIADEMNWTEHVHGREGAVGKRPRNEIGYHAVRVGDDVGQHTIVFGMMGELIELRVAASSRDAYATGAIAAAKFLLGKSPGLYSMNDVLGIG